MKLGNLKVIKNTLPSKSGNSKSLIKKSRQLESSSTKAYIVSDGFLSAFYKSFYLRVCVSNDSEKSQCIKDFTSNLRNVFA